MKTFPRTPVAAVTLLMIQALAFAQQTSPNALPVVAVSSSPIIEANRVDGFSTLTTTVSETQIRDLGALDLAAALRMAPGVQISRYNEVGSYSGDQGGNVYIRGLGASRPGSEIKTYLDGIPVFMGTWNHPMMDLLPLNGVGSVVVHKSPQLQSSGNNFASIQLESKRAVQDGVQGEASISAGSLSTTVLQASLLGRSSELDYSLALGSADSAGTRNNANGNLNNAMGKVQLKINNVWSVAAGFLSVANKVGDPGDNRFPVSATPVGPYSFSNGIGKNNSATQMLTATVRHAQSGWSGEFTLYDNQGHNDLTNDANWGTFNSSFKMNGFRWKEEFVPWQGGQITAGIDQDNVPGSISGPHVGSAVGTPFAFGTAGSTDIPAFNLTSTHVALSHQIALNNQWKLQPSAGVRSYSHNRYASKTAASAGLSLISDTVTFYANAADAVLYPGAETYTPTRAIPMAFAANNCWDRLSPTENRHTEIGVKWEAGSKTQVDLSVFQDDISKRYVWTGFFGGAIANPASGTWSNSFPDYRVNGTELSVQHEVNRQWDVFGSVTAMDSSISNLPYLPKTAISLGATGKVAGYRLTVDAQHQSSMYSLTQDRGAFAPNEVGAFTVLNTRISRALPQLGKRGEMFLIANNLLDASYQYNAGYPMPGRNFRVGVTASF